MAGRRCAPAPHMHFGKREACQEGLSAPPSRHFAGASAGGVSLPSRRGEARPRKSERFGPGQEEIEKLPKQNVYFPKR